MEQDKVQFESDDEQSIDEDDEEESWQKPSAYSQLVGSLQKTSKNQTFYARIKREQEGIEDVDNEDESDEEGDDSDENDMTLNDHDSDAEEDEDEESVEEEEEEEEEGEQFINFGSYGYKVMKKIGIT